MWPPTSCPSAPWTPTHPYRPVLCHLWIQQKTCCDRLLYECKKGSRCRETAIDPRLDWSSDRWILLRATQKEHAIQNAWPFPPPLFWSNIHPLKWLRSTTPTGVQVSSLTAKGNHRSLSQPLWVGRLAYRHGLWTCILSRPQDGFWILYNCKACECFFLSVVQVCMLCVHKHLWQPWCR